MNIPFIRITIISFCRNVYSSCLSYNMLKLPHRYQVHQLRVFQIPNIAHGIWVLKYNLKLAFCMWNRTICTRFQPAPLHPKLVNTRTKNPTSWFGQTFIWTIGASKLIYKDTDRENALAKYNYPAKVELDLWITNALCGAIKVLECWLKTSREEHVACVCFAYLLWILL